MDVPFGSYAPDLPSRVTTPYVLNVTPKSKVGNAVSFAPIGALSSVSNALTNRPQGAFSGRDSDGNVATFAGDVNDLFKLSGQTWNNVSKSSGAYSVAADGAANFAQYGNRVVAALGVSDPLQSYVMGTSSAFADISSAPNARHVANVGEFIMAGNTSNSPEEVHWSAINDPTNWPTPGSTAAAQVQSDSQILPLGGWVQYIAPTVGGVDGTIIKESAIYRVVYQGPPTVFGFYAIEEDRGTPAPNSCVGVGNRVFFLGEDGFYLFDGQQSVPIGHQRVDKAFFRDLDQNYFYRIYAAADPINKNVWWTYPGLGNTGGRPNRVLVYNWALGEWGYGEFETEVVFGGLSDGYTLEQLDAFGTLDTLPFSLDSRVWTGGRLVLSAFDGDNKLARFAGSNAEALIDTQEFGGKGRAFIDGIRSYVESESDPTVTVALRTRDTPGGPLTTTAFSPIDADGMAHFTVSARYARARVKVEAGSTWDHAEGIDYVATPDGDL